MDIEKIVEVSILFDFYKQLLTEKQREVVSFYYDEDYSLGEISENLNISRQAVYDTLKRSEKVLKDYEDKLGFVKRLNEKSRYIEDIYEETLNIENNLIQNRDCDDIIPSVEKLKEICRELLG